MPLTFPMGPLECVASGAPSLGTLNTPSDRVRRFDSLCPQIAHIRVLAGAKQCDVVKLSGPDQKGVFLDGSPASRGDFRPLTAVTQQGVGRTPVCGTRSSAKASGLLADGSPTANGLLPRCPLRQL
jgi:hypothetical protein